MPGGGVASEVFGVKFFEGGMIMKITKTSFLVSAVAAGTLLGSAAIPEDKKGKEPGAKGAGVNKEEAMKKMAEAAKPGAKHNALEAFVGEWNVAGQCWMEPGGPATPNKGTASVKWVMDGKFVREDFQGEFMGQQFKGVGLTGYDNVKGKYVGVWIDDMSTGIFNTVGDADGSGKRFTFRGTMADPMTGEKEKPMKFVVKIVDANSHTFEMHDLSRGEAHSKTMEMTYTRK